MWGMWGSGYQHSHTLAFTEQVFRLILPQIRIRLSLSLNVVMTLRHLIAERAGGEVGLLWEEQYGARAVLTGDAGTPSQWPPQPSQYSEYRALPTTYRYRQWVCVNNQVSGQTRTKQHDDTQDNSFYLTLLQT